MARINEVAAGGKNVIAFLDMLAYSEGTDNGRQKTKDDGYDVLVGGGLFAGYADHPRKLIRIDKLNISSTAAGRYQILSRYYDAYKKQLSLPDFSPVSQDKIALQMMRECRAIPMLQQGDIKAAIMACASRWASLPGAGYGQYEHKIDVLVQQWRKAGGE